MVLASKLLVSLTLLIIIAVAGANNYTDCDAKWMAYGCDKKLNDERREELQKMLLRLQADVGYACEHERIAAQIRDKVLEKDPKFTYAIDLVFAEKKKLHLDEVTVFPEGMLEGKLQEINIDASSFGCARSDGTEQPPSKTISKSTTTKNKKNKNKKKPAKKPKKQKGSKKAKMPAKAVKGKNTAKKGKPNPKNKVKKGKKSGKGKHKKKGPKPSVKPPAFNKEPAPLKAVFYVCVYKFNTAK